MREPDLTNAPATIRAWHYLVKPGVGPADWSAGLGSWLIECDPNTLDPIFTKWFVGGVSLRDIEGVPPANRQYPEAEYELNCFTVDPESGVGPEHYERMTTEGAYPGAPTRFLVQPPDVVFQWHGTSDEEATEILEAFVRAVVLGGLSPSRPPVGYSHGVAFLPGPARAFDAAWRRRLVATVEHYTTGHRS